MRLQDGTAEFQTEEKDCDDVTCMMFLSALHYSEEWYQKPRLPILNEMCGTDNFISYFSLCNSIYY